MLIVGHILQGSIAVCHFPINPLSTLAHICMDTTIQREGVELDVLAACGKYRFIRNLALKC